MALTVTLEFSDTELEHFRALLRRIRARAGTRTPREIVAAANDKVARLRSATHSPFVLRRLDRVSRLAAMLDDPEWQLPEPERRRVLGGLAYVAESQDLVPDDIPVFGLADDAIVLELLLRELQPEIDGYEEFDAYRRDEVARRDKPGLHAQPHVSREDWLDSKREALHARMRERRERDLAAEGDQFRLITHF